MTAAALTPQSASPALSPAMRGAAWGVAAVAIWGIYLAFARANVSAGIQPADLAFVRYTVAGAIMLPWLTRHSPTTLAGIGWRRGIVLSLLAGPLFILVGASGFLFAPLPTLFQAIGLIIVTFGLLASQRRPD